MILIAIIEQIFELIEGVDRACCLNNGKKNDKGIEDRHEGMVHTDPNVIYYGYDKQGTE